MGANSTNKCNINSSVATLIDNRKWGVTTSKDTIKSIIENYRVYLNCETDDIDVCYPDNCINEALRIACSIVISNITAIQTLPIITFKAIFTNTNSTNNIFQWSFDTHIFDFVSDDGTGTLVLRVKSNIDLATTTARVSVVITDEHGCLSTRNCYLVKGVMDCTNPPCNNVYDLVVTLNTN